MAVERVKMAGAWALRHEGWLVTGLGTLIFMAVPLMLGYMSLSWDAINHHFYLGWSAEHSRFEHDYLAASYQSYQYPYLYWPIYKAAALGASGTGAGILVALMHATAIPAVWLISRQSIPGKDAFAAAMRGVAVALSFASGAILSMFDTTANDLLAATPLLWSYAVALQPIGMRVSGTVRWAAASGMLAGMAVAFKLSNGVLGLALPVLWLWPAGTPGARVGRCIAASLCAMAAFGIFYGYWGWQLWSHYGNPIYPMYDDAFSPLREWAGWQR